MAHRCSIEIAVDEVLARLPAHIHMGLPLGLGKPNRFVNALYARVRALPERRLTIYTALSLGRPDLGDGLQRVMQLEIPAPMPEPSRRRAVLRGGVRLQHPIIKL